MINRKIWTTEEIDWFKLNYPIYGIAFCMEKLQITKNQLISKRARLGLKLNRELFSTIHMKDKESTEYAVNPDPFINVTTSQISYILGLWWADGTIYYRNTIGNRQNKISLTLIKPDFDEIKPLFEKTGKWCYSFWTSKRNTNVTYHTVSTNNKKLVTFLMSKNFHIKSGNDADLILSSIPIQFHYSFFQGLIDGDGCCYFNKKNSTRKVTVTSTYDQDWNFLTAKYRELGIKYKHIKRVSSNGKYSRIEICGRHSISKLKNYIYPNEFIFGLSRKYKKFMECIE